LLAEIPSKLEPISLLLQNKRRPDGMSLNVCSWKSDFVQLQITIY